jgi:hypothetical protein
MTAQGAAEGVGAPRATFGCGTDRTADYEHEDEREHDSCSKWPKWIGSNDPPMRPIRLRIPVIQLPSH